MPELISHCLQQLINQSINQPTNQIKFRQSVSLITDDQIMNNIDQSVNNLIDESII